MVTNNIHFSEQLDCVYYSFLNNCDDFLQDKKNPQVGFGVRPVLSIESYDDFRSIVRCPLPSENFTGTVHLQRSGYAAQEKKMST